MFPQSNRVIGRFSREKVSRAQNTPPCGSAGWRSRLVPLARYRNYTRKRACGMKCSEVVKEIVEFDSVGCAGFAVNESSLRARFLAPRCTPPSSFIFSSVRIPPPRPAVSHRAKRHRRGRPILETATRCNYFLSRTRRWESGVNLIEHVFPMDCYPSATYEVLQFNSRREIHRRMINTIKNVIGIYLFGARATDAKYAKIASRMLWDDTLRESREENPPRYESIWLLINPLIQCVRLFRDRN